MFVIYTNNVGGGTAPSLGLVNGLEVLYHECVDKF